MSRTPARFPIAFRSAALILVLVVVSLATGPTGAGAAPSSQQVQDAKARVAQLLGELKDMKAKLDAIDQDLAAATAEVDRQKTALDKITADLLGVQAELRRTQAHYEGIVAQLNSRAAEAFMNGPASNLDFILGASSLPEMSDRIEFASAVAQSDADLAQEVANTRNQLQAQQSHLTQLQAEQTQAVASAQAAQQKVYAYFQTEKSLVAGMAAKTAEAEKTAQQLSKQRQAYLVQLASQDTYGGGHTDIPMPPGWDKVFQRCPVDGPRSFSDGFGAPRYAGGFHLHAGVDILSPTGTPIVAPFDGTAAKTYNTLGGNSEYVYGKVGYVYNAHLSAYSSNSTGFVHAGDVIGYVGDTGDAIGTPHDHFEFHPNVIPGAWPASAYGYSVIGTAINPYPMLVAACG
ncbi:MAG: peptidoglycan DD-metalloendopeptidase family protein [Actinomycetota bacterium]|nr:peptidoglycan DD-metalloendopeptidase family protein [Actinomycetota bacterium]